MLKLKLLKSLALCVEINAAHGSLYLVEANIVESFEAGAGDCSDSVVRDEEVFLPPHEHVLMLSKVTKCKISLLGLFSKWFPCWKPRPVMDIGLLVGSPFLVARNEAVFSANHLALKESRQSRVIFSEALDTQVTAKVRLGYVHMLDFHIHVVNLLIRHLSTSESASRAKKRGSVVWQEPNVGKFITHQRRSRHHR